MNTVKNMAIIGAGVAGLALAIFARKQGIKVTPIRTRRKLLLNRRWRDPVAQCHLCHSTTGING